MADDRSRAVKLEIGEGKPSISSRSSEHREAGETIATEYRGEKITVGFIAAYLNDVFNSFDEEEISFEIKNGESAAMFTINSPYQDRCLAMREKALGPDHPDTASSLSNLAVLYYEQGKYTEAEPLCKRALAMREKALGPDHPDTATSLSNLGLIYRAQGKYVEAEPLYKRALSIREKALGPDHPDTAFSLNDLANLYYMQGRTLIRRWRIKQAVVYGGRNTVRSMQSLRGNEGKEGRE